MRIKNRTKRSSDVCYEVLCAVADCHGVDPGQIDEPLNEVVDTDGLASLWRTDGERAVNGTLSFDFYDCRVTVTSDGSVEAMPL
jgi:hypothetical protein